MEDTFKKNKGNAGLKGVQFQLDLVIMFLLNALRSCSDWKISSEDEEADKYDDLVFISPDKKVFLQAKFKENKKITRDQLFSSNSKKADFSLPKYFFAYLKNRSKVKETTVIVCTNTDVNPKGLESILTSHAVVPDSLLHYDGATCPYFTFNENILPDLKESVDSYFDKNLGGKGFDKELITDENVKDFLRSFQFFYKYPSGENIHQVMEILLCRLGGMWRKTTYHEIYQKVEEWFKQRKGEYLTVSRANAMLCEIRSDQYRNALKNYHISFQHNNFDFSNSKKIVHVKTDGGYLLQVLRTFQELQNDSSKQLYVNPNEDIEMHRLIVEAFRLPRYVFLIMVWPKTGDATVKLEISSKLREALEKQHYKKIFLLTKADVDVAQLIGLPDISHVDGSVTFQDFANNSREGLLKNKNILFQGERVSLAELLETTEVAEDRTQSWNSTMLEELVRGEVIKVGERVLDLDKGVSQYYVYRTFKREIIGEEKSSDAIPEENLFEVTKKVVLISDSPGMGKSTTLTKMAAHIKQKYSRLWVIKINLMEYTRILKDCLRNKRETMTIEELMNSREATKFNNPFEKFVFLMNARIILLLDGVDEIAPNYTNLILHMVRHCQEATNISKVFATTRPHMIGKLRTVLNVESFKMLPFTTENQIECLVKYWSHNLQLEDKGQRKAKCAQYAKILIGKMSSWTQSSLYEESTIGAIPLQVKMIADVFQEESTWEAKDWQSCKEFLSGTEKEPKLPGKLDISKLYDMFIDRKRDIFLDKGNPTGNTIADEGLIDQFEERLVHHRNLALKVILTENDCKLFSTYKECDSGCVLKIGIVQANGDNLFFIHRTFAEYFVATGILQELQLDPSVEFQKFLIDEVLVKHEFIVIRGFLDNCLKKLGGSLSCNIFAKYQSHTYHVNFNLVFKLVDEGRVAILQLILKSIEFRIIRGKVVKPARLKMDSRDWIRNTLNYLQFITQEGGVNIADLAGYTPLHHAAQIYHLEMVKFLLDQGADINIETEDGRTPLLAAAAGVCTLNTVKCLVENGANINGRDKKGRTALHWVVLKGELDAIKYIVACGANVNDKCSQGRTALHWAAEGGELDAIKYVVECGASVNDRDGDGRTALHWAVQRRILDIVKYIVERGANINDRDNNGRTSLHWAVEKGQLNGIKYIVDCGADINDRDGDGRTALHFAAARSDLNIIGYLLESGGNVNDRSSDGSTALHWAVKKGKLVAVKYIVEQGANVNDRDTEGCTALHWIAKVRELDAIRYMMERGANVNDRDIFGHTALHWLIGRRQLEAVKYIVKCGARVSDRGSDGRTILHWAVVKGRLDAIKYIVECGANVNDKNNNGRTALYWAVHKRTLVVIKYLVECGANVNNRDCSSRTLLHCAANRGEVDIIKYIVKCGANIADKDCDGRTALHWAVRKGQLDAIKCLVECGANIHDRDNDGRTAAELSRHIHYFQNATYLESLTNDVNNDNIDNNRCQ